METATANSVQPNERAQYLELVHACGHVMQIKVAITVRSEFVRELLRDARREDCRNCVNAAARKARAKKA